METGLFHVNEQFNLTVLEDYIEEHPEHAENWLEFLQKRDQKLLDFQRTNRRTPPSNTIVTPDPGEPLECNIPADFENVCIKCKRTWDSTPGHLTTSLLCGHKYHTACWVLHVYEDTDNCIFEGCGQSTYVYVRDLCRRRERMKVDTISVLTNAIINKREFKFDIKRMRRQISSFTKAFRKMDLKQKNLNNTILKKHIYSIREIQSDMNDAIKDLSKSEEKNKCLKEVSLYRRIERDIFRKYHLSLRDLMRKRIIKRMSWRIRSVLERHGMIGSYRYKFGIRIYPGSKKWNMDESDEETDDTDSGSDIDIDDLPGTE